FARIEQFNAIGDGTDRIFVIDQRGKMYYFTPGDVSPTLYFDFGANIPDFKNANQLGLRGFAFHPNAFTPGEPGYQKMYTAHHRSNPLRSVVSEWTLDGSTNVIAASMRELLTRNQPEWDHNVGKVKFNPNVPTNDPDFGNLYISFGDGANYKTEAGDTILNPNGQNKLNFFGTILRINPLQDGSNPYTIPEDNPFVGDADFLPEIWAYGLRNPHQFSWDTEGSNLMLIANIGQSNAEEIELGISGANYGWPIREGTFDMTGKAPDNPIAADTLPADHTNDVYTYPLAQYDHDFDNQGQNSAAIAGGFVYRGTQIAELRGKYIFGNFGTSSNVARFGAADTNIFQDVYVVDVDQLQLRDDFSDYYSYHDGFLAPIQRVQLVDTNNMPINLLELVRDISGNSTQRRTDMRFGIDNDGEVYISSKKSGCIWRFVGSSSVTLSIEQTGANETTISWTPETQGVVLQESSNLLSNDWSNVFTGPTNPAVIPTTGTNKYYRVVIP
ncbi:MAG TPA: PQQ-dependent sugar dehydrogenase, partial [Pontiella sp.]